MAECPLWFVKLMTLRECRYTKIGSWSSTCLKNWSLCPMEVSKYKHLCPKIYKTTTWICIFCQLHIQIRFHHRFCWPSRGKKILDGFSSRTTGHTFRTFWNLNFLEWKPQKISIVWRRSKDGIDIKTLNDTNTQNETIWKFLSSQNYFINPLSKALTSAASFY